MKLLFDDNLSWRLEKLLQETFPNSKHVRSIDALPDPAKDTQIWNYALKHDFIIVTNDDDFYKLAMSKKRCPKIIIFRMGNIKTNDVAFKLETQRQEIASFAENREFILYEIR